MGFMDKVAFKKARATFLRSQLGHTMIFSQVHKVFRNLPRGCGSQPMIMILSRDPFS